MMQYFKKQFRSFAYAFDGLRLMLKDYNIFVHLPAAILAIIFGFVFQISKIDFLFICSAIAAVWICEIINTALEKLVDLVSPQKNKLAGQIKDLAASAVLIATLYALVVGCTVFGSYFWSFLFKNY